MDKVLTVRLTFWILSGVLITLQEVKNNTICTFDLCFHFGDLSLCSMIVLHVGTANF